MCTSESDSSSHIFAHICKREFTLKDTYRKLRGNLTLSTADRTLIKPVQVQILSMSRDQTCRYTHHFAPKNSEERSCSNGHHGHDYACEEEEEEEEEKEEEEEERCSFCAAERISAKHINVTNSVRGLLRTHQEIYIFAELTTDHRAFSALCKKIGVFLFLRFCMDKRNLPSPDSRRF